MSSISGIVGRLVYSPEIRFAPSGETVLSFELECAGRNILCEKVDGFAETFGMADVYPEAGTRVVVEGSPHVRKWNSDGHTKTRTILRLTYFAFRDEHGDAHRYGD